MEIKFRIRHKKTGEISYGTLQELIDEGGVNYGTLYEDYTWDLYIGLEDKNGVEIYDGDIVGEESVYHFLERDGWQPRQGQWQVIGEKSKNFTGKGEEKYIAGFRLTVVEWKDSSCGFEPFSDSEENCGHCGGGRQPSNFVVIGNIYENPELLVKE